jgi:hypothetical protein
MRMQVVSQTFTAILGHRFNSRGYCTRRQEYEANFVSYSNVLCQVRGRNQERDRKIKQKSYVLHILITSCQWLRNLTTKL